MEGKLGKGKGRLELGVGKQCGHREVNGGRRERNALEQRLKTQKSNEKGRATEVGCEEGNRVDGCTLGSLTILGCSQR